MPAKKDWITLTCQRPGCGQTFTVWPSRAEQLYCSKSCSNSVNGRNGSTHNDRTSQHLPEMIALYQSGVSAPALAERYGVSTSVICRRLKRAGVQLRNGGNQKAWNDAMRQKRAAYHQTHPTANRLDLPTAVIARRYDSGETAEIIAASMGVSEIAIRQRLKEAGVDFRDPGIGRRVYAKDGHRVRSSLECAVDNWLSDHGLDHEVEPRCPWDTRRTPMRADFRVGATYIEVWGIIGKKSYDQRRAEKQQLYCLHHVHLIELLPTHLQTADYSPLDPLLM